MLTDQKPQTEQEKKIAGLIIEFSKDKDILDLVKRIESRIATTQDHYGDYMAFLGDYTSKPMALYIISEALILAGANTNGVHWAIKILKGN